MRYSKPSKRPKLISIGANGAEITDLLTEKVSGRLMWLRQRIYIGDAWLREAKSLLESYEEIGLGDFFDRCDLRSIKSDGLDNLMFIGADGEGHEYMVGKRSHQYYVRCHEETQFEKVAGTTKSFLQWVICERSDHLEGCPWEVFTTGGRTFFKDVWHSEQVDPAPILDKAKELYEWDRQYFSPHGFELLSEKDEFDLRFKKEHRGRNSHIQMVAARKPPKLDVLLRWLKDRGFGQPSG